MLFKKNKEPGRFCAALALYLILCYGSLVMMLPGVLSV
jgi:hypothetical protein